MIGITILGSTGSIGCNTLEVLFLHPNQYNIFALTANHNVDVLYAQCLRFHPKIAVMLNASAAEQLQSRLKNVAPEITVLSGLESLEKVASHSDVDYVMAAIVGSAGLLPTLAAVRAGKRVLLANKETLVMAGAFFINEVEKYGATLLPIDSEHNALFQCMPLNRSENAVKKLILTASGGPFRKLPLSQLENVTPDQACAHPTWNMGKKISVDSATMMNKGFEVIEAHWLFSMPPSQIEVILHPESIVHSLVEYVDGSLLAQLSNPDMRTPIAHAMAWPKRMASGVKPLDLLSTRSLTFEAVDLNRYPCLRLAYNVIQKGGTSPAILNAANEVAVQAFLSGQCAFTDIWRIIESVLSKVTSQSALNLATILEADEMARKVASENLLILA